MNGKQFAKWALGATALFAGILIAFVVMVDPFFQFRIPETAVFENERYENAGIIRNSEYDTVIMGTSLVCNFRASWFDELTGGQTLKIGFRDGYLSDFDTALRLAYQTEPDIEAVYFGLDTNILIRSDAQRTADLPAYLYDNNPLNDVSYYLNKDVYLRCFNMLAEQVRGNAVPLDEAYVWSGDAEFSAWQSLAGYVRPAVSATVLEKDAFYAAVDENLAVIDGWVTEHPETEFHIFLSPYSIIYWDRTARMGRLEATLGALEYAIPKLLEYDNVTVHFFMDNSDIVTYMGFYTDHIHFSDGVSKKLSEWMVSGLFQVTEETWQTRMDALETLVRGYDYDTLLAPYGK